MKRFSTIFLTSMFLLVIAFAAAKSEKSGQELFYKLGCTCHHPTKDFTFGNLGPSLQRIAKEYKYNPSELIPYLKGGKKSIIDTKRHHIMKPFLQRMKGLSDSEFQQLADYILMHK